MPARTEEQLEELYEKVTSRSREVLEPMLRMKAFKYKWPSEIISALHIDFDDDFNMSVNCPQALRSKVDDLEYGTPWSAPSYVIRDIEKKAESIIIDILNEEYMDDIVTLVGIL